MKRYKIAVDAGHGMNTPGKRSPDGEREWSFNNRVVIALTARLNEYGCFDVIRTDDSSGKTDVPLATRVRRANNAKADLFVSVHQNAYLSKWGGHGGTETYYYGGDVKGKRLATLVQRNLVNALGLRDRGVKDGSHLYVVRNTYMTAILTEGAFMDSTTDIKLLRNDVKLKAQGIAIADGIAEYLGVSLPSKKEAEEMPKQQFLNETGRKEAREIIKRAVKEGVFTSKHENVDKYDDGTLVSYVIAYVNRVGIRR